MLPDHIILFDGICNFCNQSVQLIIRRDRQGRFHFASLQSETGKALLEQYGLNDQGIDSVVYIHRDKAYIKSTAALQIARRLDGPLKILYIFIMLPVRFRDILYDFIAANRYKWFGKREACMLPDPAQKARFL